MVGSANYSRGPHDEADAEKAEKDGRDRSSGGDTGSCHGGSEMPCCRRELVRDPVGDPIDGSPGSSFRRDGFEIVIVESGFLREAKLEATVSVNEFAILGRRGRKPIFKWQQPG